MTTLHNRIAERFRPPEWVVLYEVRDANGFGARRSADAIVEALKVGEKRAAS